MSSKAMRGGRGKGRGGGNSRGGGRSVQNSQTETKRRSISSSQTAQTESNMRRSSQRRTGIMEQACDKMRDLEKMNVEEEDDLCGVCDLEVFDEDKALSCNWCKKWFHTSCEGTSDDEYDLINGVGSSENVKWFCNMCCSTVVSSLKFFDMVDKKHVEMDERIKVVEDKTDKHDERLSNLENKSADIDKCFQEVKEYKGEVNKVTKRLNDMDETVDKVIEMKLEEVHEEEKERFRRQQYIMVYGLSEFKVKDVADRREYDEGMTKKLMEQLGCEEEEFSNVIRIGKYDEKRPSHRPRPMRFRVMTVEKRNMILRKGNELKASKNEELKNVYLAPDRTPKERDTDKKLRDELRSKRENEKRENGEKEFVIRNGKVVEKKSHYSK